MLLDKNKNNNKKMDHIPHRKCTPTTNMVKMVCQLDL